jgi:hypothetical protein
MSKRSSIIHHGHYRVNGHNCELTAIIWTNKPALTLLIDILFSTESQRVLKQIWDKWSFCWRNRQGITLIQTQRRLLGLWIREKRTTIRPMLNFEMLRNGGIYHISRYNVISFISIQTKTPL